MISPSPHGLMPHLLSPFPFIYYIHTYTFEIHSTTLGSKKSETIVFKP